jgi:hypothetical protein
MLRRFIAALRARGAFELAVLVLLALLGAAYAAGYFTRGYISRRRRERASIWKNYIEPEWPQPANTNQAAPKMTHGDLGQMLNRWEDRARLRRSHRKSVSVPIAAERARRTSMG